MEKKGRFHPLQSLCTAFSLYSRIPVPHREVTADGFRYALCFFPCVGALTGIVIVFLAEAASAVHLGQIAFSCAGTAIPLIISGGIHMDGFLDTADALSSLADAEKKREILKDPHTGAFAFIWGTVYILIYVAAFSELKSAAFPAAAGIFVLSRALSGFSVVALKKAEGPGMLKSLSDESDDRAVMAGTAVWVAATMLFFLFTAGWVLMLAEGAAAFMCLALCNEMAKREFGGMSGDLAGFFLQVCELLLLVILAVFQ